MRTSTGFSRLLPRRRTVRVSIARRSFDWTWSGSSPISSRKIVPPCASSKTPRRSISAPLGRAGAHVALFEPYAFDESAVGAAAVLQEDALRAHAHLAVHARHGRVREAQVICGRRSDACEAVAHGDARAARRAVDDE